MSNLQAHISELEALPLFEGIPRDQIEKLCEGGRVQVTKHRETLFRAGDEARSFGIVLSGAYKLCRPSPMGEDVIMHFSTTGDVIAAFVMSKPDSIYPVSAISMGPSRLLRIPKNNYVNSWGKNHEIIFRIQSFISTRMSHLHDQKVLSRAPLSQKIAALLMNLLEKNNNDEGLFLPLPLTRREIADTLGSSVESVIRIMSEWSKQGLIQTTDQHIKVVHPEKIIEILKNSET